MAITLEFETEEQAKTWAIQFVKQSKKEFPSNLFRDVRFSDEELLEINNNYDFIINQAKEVAHYENMANFIYVEKLEFNKYGTSAITLGSFAVHDLIRKLSLAIYGVQNNKDMNKRDFEEAKIFYKQIKNLFLEEYTKRLEKISGEIKNERINKNHSERK